MEYTPYLVVSVVGYFLGSVPTGYLVAKAHGVDIFKVGSGNPGATNVKRVLGSKAGNTVFAFDALKGALAAGWPVWLCYFTRPNGYFCGNDIGGAYLFGLAGVLAGVLGHSFSVFTHFKGGKGVATAAGGLVVLIPVSCLSGAVVWVLIFYSTRYVSLGSIMAAVVVPTVSWLLGNPLPLNIVTTALGLFVIFRHRENIRRLLNGTENRFVKKSAVPGEKEKPGAQP